MNLDSDMLVVEDYFAKVTKDLEITRNACETPIVSGYSSSIWKQAFGCASVSLYYLVHTYIHLD